MDFIHSHFEGTHTKLLINIPAQHFPNEYSKKADKTDYGKTHSEQEAHSDSCPDIIDKGIDILSDIDSAQTILLNSINAFSYFRRSSQLYQKSK